MLRYGAFATLLAGFDLLIQNLRGKFDMLNPTLAGAITGAIFGLPYGMCLLSVSFERPSMCFSLGSCHSHISDP